MQYKIQNLLQKYNLKPSKRLGQNFLIDENILKKIIEAAELKPEDIVLEIGPGSGILTVELAKRVGQVIAIEKDRTLFQVLKDILKAEGINNVKVINKDILQISNFPACAEASAGRKFLISNYKIIANLPYYITSPVIRKFLEIKNKPELMVLMLQKEVAQRIVAKPPHMNLLAVSVQFYAMPKIVSYVSKNSFWPRPKVDSAIIKITPIPKKSEMLFLRLQGGVINLKNNRGVVGSPPCRGAKITSRISDAESLFFQLVKAGFSSKRKMLKNNLSKKLKIKSQKLKVIFKKLNIHPKARAENLSLDDWVKLYENL